MIFLLCISLNLIECLELNQVIYICSIFYITDGQTVGETDGQMDVQQDYIIPGIQKQKASLIFFIVVQALLLCGRKGKYLVTCKVGKYCCWALHGRVAA